MRYEPRSAAVGAASSREAGFLLLEFLIVISVVALAAYLALPLFNRRNADGDVTATATRIASELRAAQASARKTNREEHVDIDVHRRRLSWGTPTRAMTLPASLVVSVEGGAVQLKESGVAKLRFQHDGSSNGAAITLRSAGRATVIVVDWLTGDTRLKRLE